MNVQDALNSAAGKVRDWVDTAVVMLPNLVAAVVVLVAAYLLGRLAARLGAKLLRRISTSDEVASLVATTLKIVVVAVGLFLALGLLQLDKTVVSLLGAAGILGLVAGLAFQDLASNFIAGILLTIRQPFRPQDLVQTNDYFGTVEAINLRATELRTLDGQHVTVPNTQVFQNPIVNYSTGTRRVDIPVGVSYGDDLEKAERVAIEAVESVSSRDTSRDVELFYESFGDSSINFMIRFWIPFEKQPDFLAARHQAVKNIKAAFDEAGITIPFPIRTLDFGIVGGQTLTEALQGTERATAK